MPSVKGVGITLQLWELWKGIPVYVSVVTASSPNILFKRPMWPFEGFDFLDGAVILPLNV